MASSEMNLFDVANLDITNIVEIKIEDTSNYEHSALCDHDYVSMQTLLENGMKPMGAGREILYFGQRFSSHREAVAAIRNYGEATNQVFVLAPGCSKTSKTHKLRELFPYSSVKFVCKHSGEYRTHRPNMVPRVRPNQQSAKMGCPVAIRLKLIEGKLEIREMIHEGQHNHPVTEELYNSYAETRRLTGEEKELATDLYKAGVAPKIIVKVINGNRRELGHKGVLQTKDIFNLGTKLRTSKEHKSDEEILEEIIQEYKLKDPEGCYDVIGPENSENSDQIYLIFIQTSRMKRIYSQYPSSCFVETAYKITAKNFCLYSLLVQDQNCFGESICLGLVKNERPNLLQTFFNKFRLENLASVNRLQAVFVSRNFSRRHVIQEVFPKACVLFYPGHVMEIFKNQISRETQLSMEEKLSLVDLFKTVLYSKTPTDFQINQSLFIEKSSKRLKDYYVANWKSDASSWCSAFASNFDLPEENDSYRIENHFVTLKTALRGSSLAVANKQTLSECAKTLLSFFDDQEADHHVTPIGESSIVDNEKCQLEVGQTFSSHEEAFQAVKLYGEATNQVFVLAGGCSRTSDKNPLHVKFPYSSVKFCCKHSGVYRSHRPGIPPKFRRGQKSCKLECPVNVKLKLNKDKELELIEMADISLHNHPLSEGIFNFYRETRKLSQEERKFAADLLSSKVSPRVVANAINTNRKQHDRKGLVLAKDICNLQAELRRNGGVLKNITPKKRVAKKRTQKFLVDQGQQTENGLAVIYLDENMQCTEEHINLVLET